MQVLSLHALEIFYPIIGGHYNDGVDENVCILIT